MKIYAIKYREGDIISGNYHDKVLNDQLYLSKERRDAALIEFQQTNIDRADKWKIHTAIEMNVKE